MFCVSLWESGGAGNQDRVSQRTCDKWRVVCTHTIGSNLLDGMASVVFGISHGGKKAHDNQGGGARRGNVFHGGNRVAKLVVAEWRSLVDCLAKCKLSSSRGYPVCACSRGSCVAFDSCEEEEEEGGCLCLLIL